MNDPRTIFGRLGNSLFQYAYIYAQMKRGEIPDIFVQSDEYWVEYKDEIQKLYGEGISSVPLNYVAIHYRRGDYINNKFYTDLSKTNYYEKAMALFPKEEFLIFSDDIRWCKDNLKGNFSFSEGDEITDFNLMASCKAIICANSSFSHMCAIINPYPNKKIICPIETKYYSDGVVRSKFSKDFIQLDFEYE